MKKATNVVKAVNATMSTCEQPNHQDQISSAISALIIASLNLADLKNKLSGYDDDDKAQYEDSAHYGVGHDMPLVTLLTNLPTAIHDIAADIHASISDIECLLRL